MKGMKISSKFALIGFLFLFKPGIGFSKKPMSKQKFYDLLSIFQQDKTIIATDTEVQIKGNWDSEIENATITRNEYDEPMIMVHGGLARHPLITEDAILLFICHELGHFFGGSPKAVRNNGKHSWSSVEGQSDYYATSKCLPRVFSQFQKAESSIYEPIPHHLESQFKQHCKSTDQICNRIAMASLQTARVIADITFAPWEPELTYKDPTVVENTLNLYPSAQCRLDTFLAGLQCRENYLDEFDDEDPTVNACEEATIEEAQRPRCWFSP